MAIAAPRLFYDNLIQRAATVLAVSSELTSMPRGRLLFPLRSDIWRTGGPWVFTAGVNDRIDFDRGGTKVATIAPGTYLTGAAASAAVVAALAAADATPVWASTYTANAFGISSDLAFTLLFGGGANVARSIAIDLGFAAADTGSATSHTAGSVSHQSRHWLHADLGSAIAFTVGAVINHNLSTPGTVRLDGHTSSMVAAGLASVPGGGFSQVLAGDAEMRQAYFASQSKQFLRFVISDVQNPAGYFEAGIIFPGPYLSLAGFEPKVTDDSEPLSESTFAVAGADYQTKRQKRRGWTLSFRSRDQAAKAALVALEDLIGAGGKFFFDFDSGTPQIRYVILPALAFTSVETASPTWDLVMRLREALG